MNEPNSDHYCDRRTVEGYWFGRRGFDAIDREHLDAFPDGFYARSLYSIAMELMTEDALTD